MPDDSRNSSTDILSTHVPCTELANAIRRLLREGLELSPSVVEFIDSTYASPSAEDLLAILNGESDSDRDTLMELLFAPDESFQVKLEPLLTRYRFSLEDQSEVTGLLKNPIPDVRLIFSDVRERISLTPPDWVIDILLPKLCIAKQQPAALEETVAQSVKTTCQNQVRVRLRNMRADLPEPQMDCLCRYLNSADTQQESFLHILDFLLQFLDDLDPSSDIYQSLMERKTECRAQLERAMKQEKALAENNMETLLLRGERVLHFDKDHLIQTIAAIDDISIAVFGKTELLLPQTNAITLGNDHGREDLERLIAFLSQG